MATLKMLTLMPEKPHPENAARVTEVAKAESALAQSVPSMQEGTEGSADDAKAEVAKTASERESSQAKPEANQDAASVTTRISAAQTSMKKKQALVLSPLAEARNNAPRSQETPKEQEAPLELNIPANMPVDIEIYVVKEGDTLWDISAHFTGNPFNYPRIAGENKIANPDLIFPGQRIRLIK